MRANLGSGATEDDTSDACRAVGIAVTNVVLTLPEGPAGRPAEGLVRKGDANRTGLGPQPASCKALWQGVLCPLLRAEPKDDGLHANDSTGDFQSAEIVKTTANVTTEGTSHAD